MNHDIELQLDNTLPPLPPPQDYGRGLYTADQMRAYAQAALDALAETDRPLYDAPISKHATLAEWWAEKQAAKQSLCPHEHATNDWRLHNSGTPAPLKLRDWCTDPDNCLRCKAPQWDQQNHDHAGIPLSGITATTAPTTGDNYL
jgi:hypothetical protein